MKIIAHRGLLDGPNKELENNPETINKAIEKGFDAEIDVWKTGDGWFLGHDEPQYKINFSYLENKKFWVHAKNIQALDSMLRIGSNIHFFWHQEDDFAITSGGLIWTSPGKELTQRSICVMPEKIIPINEAIKLHCMGICTDFAAMAKTLIDVN